MILKLVLRSVDLTNLGEVRLLLGKTHWLRNLLALGWPPGPLPETATRRPSRWLVGPSSPNTLLKQRWQPPVFIRLTTFIEATLLKLCLGILWQLTMCSLVRPLSFLCSTYLRLHLTRLRDSDIFSVPTLCPVVVTIRVF